MGRWDYGLMSSDADLDFVDDMSNLAGCELYHPEDPEKSRKILDSGTLSKTFDTYLAEFKDGNLQGYGLVILCTCAMMLGANIEPKYLNIMRGIYKSTKHYEKGKVQFKHMLDTYKNDGTPVDFHSPSIEDVVNDPMSDTNIQSRLHPPATGGFDIINVGGPFEALRSPWPRTPGTGTNDPSSKSDVNLPADFDVTGKPRCWSCTKVNDALSHCAKCRRAQYCSRECQKADWKVHKKICETPEKTKQEKMDNEVEKEVEAEVEKARAGGD